RLATGAIAHPIDGIAIEHPPVTAPQLPQPAADLDDREPPLAAHQVELVARRRPRHGDAAPGPGEIACTLCRHAQLSRHAPCPGGDGHVGRWHATCRYSAAEVTRWRRGSRTTDSSATVAVRRSCRATGPSTGSALRASTPMPAWQHWWVATSTAAGRFTPAR